MLSLLLHKHDLLCGVALPVLTQVVTFQVILMLERPVALQAAERPRGGVSPLDVLLHHGDELGLVAAALAEAGWQVSIRHRELDRRKREEASA